MRQIHVSDPEAFPFRRRDVLKGLKTSASCSGKYPLRYSIGYPILYLRSRLDTSKRVATNLEADRRV
jgi:hypothetical protein